MSRALKKNALLQSVGTSIKNNRGKSLGEIMEITHSEESDNAEYVILKSSEFFGPGDRYFAIPASSNIISVGENGKITVNLSPDDLQFAKGVSAQKCPKPNLEMNTSIYELYQYRDPQLRSRYNQAE